MATNTTQTDDCGAVGATNYSKETHIIADVALLFLLVGPFLWAGLILTGHATTSVAVVFAMLSAQAITRRVQP